MVLRQIPALPFPLNRDGSCFFLFIRIIPKEKRKKESADPGRCGKNQGWFLGKLEGWKPLAQPLIFNRVVVMWEPAYLACSFYCSGLFIAGWEVRGDGRLFCIMCLFLLYEDELGHKYIV